jgi:carboxyl-terminal processing protease
MKCLIVLTLIFVFTPLHLSEAAAVVNPVSVFQSTMEIVNKNFYDQTFRGLRWKSLVDRAAKKISASTSDAKLEDTINTLLANLHTSHTEFVSSSDQEYWALESVFSFQVDGKPLWQIGAWFVKIDGHWFIRNIFEGGPAARAGMLAGDEVVSVNGNPFSPVDSFNTGKSEKFSVEIRRLKNGKTKTITVVSVLESFQRSMLNASIASYHVFNLCGHRIGYFHLWAGTNDESMNALTDAAKKAASETDALILDLRDGFGGAYPAFLNPFFNHDDQGKAIAQIYAKPMSALINDGVRSGKEWIADILKQTHRAKLLGSHTKGYFLAAKVFPVIKDKFDLYLAVAKGPGPDLEGKGVIPDIEISSSLPYSNGTDLILKRAIDELRPDRCTEK